MSSNNRSPKDEMRERSQTLSDSPIDEEKKWFRRRLTKASLFTQSDDEDEGGPLNDNDNMSILGEAEEVFYDASSKMAPKGSKNLTKFREVSDHDYKDLSKELLDKFLSLVKYEKEGDFGWKKIKDLDEVALYRKKSDDGNPLDIIKGVVQVDASPDVVYEALKNERYSHLLHPDFLSCEQLEVFFPS